MKENPFRSLPGIPVLLAVLAAMLVGAVCFLASSHAAYISGADLRVDGGTIRNVN